MLNTGLSQFDKPQDASKGQIVGAVTTGLGLAVLIGPYGITGAAITTSISYWAGALVSYGYWRKLQGQVARGEVTGHTEAVEVEEFV